MIDFECNIFENTKDMDCSNVRYVSSILKGIRDGRWKEQIEKVRALRDEGNKSGLEKAKFNLPAVIFSGVFVDRYDEFLVLYSNFMIIDIDKISKRRTLSLRTELMKNPHVFSFWDGPTKGLKVLVMVDSNHKNHYDAFIHLERVFMELYNIEIDKSGKNLSRLCYVSYDPLIYVNPYPEPFKVEIIPFKPLETRTYYNGPKSYDSKQILDHCIKMTKASRTGGYHKGNRNNFIFVLSCLACEFGIPEEMTCNLIAERYQSVKLKETNSTVKSAYRKCKQNFGKRVLGVRENKNQQPLL